MHKKHSLAVLNAALGALAWLVACSDAPTSSSMDSGAGSTGGGTSSTLPGATSAGSTASDPFSECAQGKLEADRVLDVPLTGPGVANGGLKSGNYQVATTYLALIPEQVKRANDLGAGVVRSLTSMKGFVAFSLTHSDACATLRTLTIWETEEDLLAFVISPVHAAAMSQLSSLDRGTSSTTSWEGTEVSATWEAAALRLDEKHSTGAN